MQSHDVLQGTETENAALKHVAKQTTLEPTKSKKAPAAAQPHLNQSKKKTDVAEQLHRTFQPSRKWANLGLTDLPVEQTSAKVRSGAISCCIDLNAKQGPRGKVASAASRSSSHRHQHRSKGDGAFSVSESEESEEELEERKQVGNTSPIPPAPMMAGRRGSPAGVLVHSEARQVSDGRQPDRHHHCAVLAARL